MHVLPLRIEDHHAAVLHVCVDAVLLEKSVQNFAAEPPKVTCDDCVIVLRRTVQVIKMCVQCRKGCRGHSRPHVVRIADAAVDDAANRGGRDADAAFPAAEQDCARSGDRPLRRRRALPAIA